MVFILPSKPPLVAAGGSPAQASGRSPSRMLSRARSRRWVGGREARPTIRRCLLRRRDDVRRKRVQLGEIEQEPAGANAMLEEGKLDRFENGAHSDDCSNANVGCSKRILKTRFSRTTSLGYCTCQGDQQWAQHGTQNKVGRHPSTAKHSSEAQQR